jgi:hypothetical protein
MNVAGSNCQCVNTSASASAWGSCAGTVGVQTLDADGAQLKVKRRRINKSEPEIVHDICGHIERRRKVF